MTKKKLNVKPGLVVKNCDSDRRRSVTVDSKTAQLASRKLIQLTGMS